LELLKDKEKDIELTATLKLEYDLLQQHDKKQKVKRDRLKDMLHHSEEVIGSRRDELDILRNDLADSEAQVDSLNAETYHLNAGESMLCYAML
jgi:hypothetical protein